jgi:hypothetical protein
MHVPGIPAVLWMYRPWLPWLCDVHGLARGRGGQTTVPRRRPVRRRPKGRGIGGGCATGSAAPVGPPPPHRAEDRVRGCTDKSREHEHHPRRQSPEQGQPDPPVGRPRPSAPAALEPDRAPSGVESVKEREAVGDWR